MINLSEFFKTFLSHDAGPLAQFIKYAFVGGLATAVNIFVFFLAGWFLFPCLTEDDIFVKLIRKIKKNVVLPVSARRSRSGQTFGASMRRYANACYCNIVAFFFSNTVCYILNRLFVFQPGKHSALVEALLFFAVSGVSVFLGTLIQTWLIAKFNKQTTVAFCANLVTSLAINYVMRRFVVFNG